MVLLRILLGMIKGALVGGLLGGALWFLETGGDLQSTETSWAWLRWPLYGVVGLLTGFVSGRPPWAGDNVRGAAWVSSVFKGIVGFGVCVGLYFLADWLVRLELWGRTPTEWYFGFGAVLGVVYATFIEIDDSIGAAKDDGPKAKPKTEAPPTAPKNAK
jgi:hypothetical protein